MICRVEVPPGYSLLLRYKGPWPFGTVARPPRGRWSRPTRRGRPLQVGILEAMPGPGRHFYSPLEYETELVKDQIIPPGKLGVVVSKVGKPLPSGATWSTRRRSRATAASSAARPDAGPLPDQQLRLRRQGRRRRRLRRALHARPAHGGRPDADPAGLRRRRDQQDRQPQDAARCRASSPQVLQPGIYFLNPEEKRVDIISVGYNETTLTVEADRR